MKNTINALIVDDSAAIRMVLRVTLRDAGFNVVEAANGEEALAHATTQQFDFIITDVEMPKVNGLDLIKKLRALTNYKFIPILSLTNLNSDRIKNELKLAGATGWIQKPFGPGSLLKTLEKLAA